MWRRCEPRHSCHGCCRRENRLVCLDQQLLQSYPGGNSSDTWGSRASAGRAVTDNPNVADSGPFTVKLTSTSVDALFIA
jgi:hypothetical protein